MTALQAFGWEFLGTALLLLLGNGVCAVNSLRTSAGKGTGWVLIAFGWGMAVFVGAAVASPSGGHLNPAGTIALASKGST
ncbi:aquaporin, partial [Corynebacterium diphtheriae]|uniref:aquaporin n=1 Tax=Corynebacterium diphtheriae TaxID=1717 RepID=UPI000D4D9222